MRTRQPSIEQVDFTKPPFKLENIEPILVMPIALEKPKRPTLDAKVMGIEIRSSTVEDNKRKNS